MYIPKKSMEIYNEIIMHRGYHKDYPENSISAIKEALSKKFAIETDVRMTKDGYLICFHDKSAKRLLGINRKISKMTYEEILNYGILSTNEKVPLLEEVLDAVHGNITLLIEIKGFLNKDFMEKIKNIMDKYDGKVYYHSINLFTFFRLRKIWKDKVFWVLNFLRDRFYFIKTRHYKYFKLMDI